MCALALGTVALADFNLPGLIPIAIVAGLVLYLGCMFIVDALWRPYAQRAWLDLVLAVGIMVVCIEYGYLAGVLVGLVCACVLFAMSYARLGAVHRHVTRAQFTSYVDRSAAASEHLRETGDAIQIYWLSGYIFFGSSEGVFERIRGDMQALPPRLVANVILDFGRVSGADSSAIVSLAKLRNFCEQQGATLVYCSLSPANQAALERGGFFAATEPAPGLRRPEPRAGLVRGPIAGQGRPRHRQRAGGLRVVAPASAGDERQSGRPHRLSGAEGR